MFPSSPSAKDNNSAVDETTPLLIASEAGPPGHANEGIPIRPPSELSDNDIDKPLPVKQILLLCYVRLLEPIAFFSIFPFINQMIWETGSIEEPDVGFYSGLIV